MNYNTDLKIYTFLNALLLKFTKYAVLCFICILTCSKDSIAQEKNEEVLKVTPLDVNRINQISDMLPDNPKGFGEPIEKRDYWSELYLSGKLAEYIIYADSIMVKPFPKLTKEIYLGYYQGKDSETSKRFIMKRRMMLTRLVVAECVSNRGKYLPAINNALTEILSTPSWTFPAEDLQKLNYQQKLYTIGLSSSAYAMDLAQTVYLLKGKLNPKLTEAVMDALWLKIFKPVKNAVANQNKSQEFTWLTSTGNHNSVTLAGVTIAALSVIKSKKERAFFVALAERYSNNSLKGFTNDGYCSEGVGYYNYGFGHYVLLRECLFQNTNGNIDIFNRPKIDKIANYAVGMEITKNVYAAIGDCDPNVKPSEQMMQYLNRWFNLGIQESDFTIKGFDQPALAPILMYFFPNSSMLKSPGKVSSQHQLRYYFDDAGILTVRPELNSKIKFGATFKGGNNNEHHNHNDIGSYSIALGDEIIMGDPGLGTYTPKYFGAERYSYKTTSSYGHSLPLVAGQQQITGKTAKAEILVTDFSEIADVFKMDITSGYQVSELKSLVRTFIFHRGENTRLEVIDDIDFSSPQRYESALITRTRWRKISDHLIEFSGKSGKMEVEIIFPGKLIITSEEILEAPTPYTRISIKPENTFLAKSLKIIYTPMP